MALISCRRGAFQVGSMANCGVCEVLRIEQILTMLLGSSEMTNRLAKIKYLPVLLWKILWFLYVHIRISDTHLYRTQCSSPRMYSRIYLIGCYKSRKYVFYQGLSRY